MDRYFYSVEMNGNEKVVHLYGNIYDSVQDNREYVLAEWTGLYITLPMLESLFKEDIFWDYIGNCVNYLTDLSKKDGIEISNTYFGNTAGKYLCIEDVTKETECGDYYF